MKKSLITSIILATGMTLGASVSYAESQFAALSNVDANPMTAAQMDAVVGLNHVSLLVASNGVTLPAGGLAATQAAAPTPDGGNGVSFNRTPSRHAAAFVNALGAPATPLTKTKL